MGVGGDEWGWEHGLAKPKTNVGRGLLIKKRR